MNNNSKSITGLKKTHKKPIVDGDGEQESSRRREGLGGSGRQGVCCSAWKTLSANNKEMCDILSEMRSQQLQAS